MFLEFVVVDVTPSWYYFHTHTCIDTTKLHITGHRTRRVGRKAPQILKCHIAFSSLGQIRCYKNMQPPWRVLKPQDCWHSCQDDTCSILGSKITLFTKDLLDKHHYHQWTSDCTNLSEYEWDKTTFNK